MSEVRSRPRPRPRRIAADEAHAWARNLKLGNPYAKLLLSMLTLYVNGEGSCFVSLPQLADDCEFAQETARKRLMWLESIGAITKLPQWIDAGGRRNAEGRGRRTTDEIRLMIHVDPEEIEARARGEDPSDADPPRGRGSDNDDEAAGPPVGLQQPPSCVGGLESLEPEPEESPPNPPPGGGRSPIDDQVEADLRKLADAYPIPITDVRVTRQLLSAMTAEERHRVILGAKGYRAFIEGERKRDKHRAVKDAHRWIRAGSHEGYVRQGQDSEAFAAMVPIVEGSDQWLAWTVYFRLCGAPGIPDFLATGSPGTRTMLRPSEWPPVGAGIDPNRSAWNHKAIEGTGSFAAWMRRLREVPNARISTRNEVQNGRHCAVLMVPTEFPPSRSSATPAADTS